nr:oligosaccharide flippase family protein [Clostridiales bacterium]
MQENKKQNLIGGAFVLVLSTVFVKVLGLMYKIPLTTFIGEVGRGYFNAAYNIYTPIFAISMAGLPVALSTLVSHNVALGFYRNARKIFRVAFMLFFVMGVVGTFFLLLIAYPYSVYLINSKQTLMSIVCIAPSVFFCCVMATYRGYYEGLCDMKPTAISQIIEAIGKTVLGLAFAYIVMKVGSSQIPQGVVFGVKISSEAEGYSVIYPYSAAGAVLGVTAGTVVGLIYLIILKRTRKDGFTKAQLMSSPYPQPTSEISRKLIRTAIPVVASSLIVNITNLIDAVTVQNRLANAVARNTDIIKQMYNTALTASNTLDRDISTYLYGV